MSTGQSNRRSWRRNKEDPSWCWAPYTLVRNWLLPGEVCAATEGFWAEQWHDLTHVVKVLWSLYQVHTNRALGWKPEAQLRGYWRPLADRWWCSGRWGGQGEQPQASTASSSPKAQGWQEFKPLKCRLLPLRTLWWEITLFQGRL